MSRSHSFSVDVAKQFGVDVALMLNHFSFWYLKNKSDNNQFIKGDFWVRMKATQLQEYYPYYTLRQLRYLVDKMIDLKLLKQDEFNTKKNDRTKWYTLTKTAKKLLNISTDKNVTNIKKIVSKSLEKQSDKNVINVTHKIDSQSDKNVTSILKEEDTKDRYIIIKEKLYKNKSLIEIIAMQNKLKKETVENQLEIFILHISGLQKKYDNNQQLFSHFQNWISTQRLSDVNLENELSWFIEVFNKISNRDFKITDTVRKRFAVVFKVGYSSKEMAKSIQNLYSSSVENKFHINSRFKFATPEYLLKEDNMNKYLNFKV